MVEKEAFRRVGWTLAVLFFAYTITVAGLSYSQNLTSQDFVTGLAVSIPQSTGGGLGAYCDSDSDCARCLRCQAPASGGGGTTGTCTYMVPGAIDSTGLTAVDQCSKNAPTSGIWGVCNGGTCQSCDDDRDGSPDKNDALCGYYLTGSGMNYCSTKPGVQNTDCDDTTMEVNSCGGTNVIGPSTYTNPTTGKTGTWHCGDGSDNDCDNAPDCKDSDAQGTTETCSAYCGCEDKDERLIAQGGSITCSNLPDYELTLPTGVTLADYRSKLTGTATCSPQGIGSAAWAKTNCQYKSSCENAGYTCRSSCTATEDSIPLSCAGSSPGANVCCAPSCSKMGGTCGHESCESEGLEMIGDTAQQSHGLCGLLDGMCCRSKSSCESAGYTCKSSCDPNTEVQAPITTYNCDGHTGGGICCMPKSGCPIDGKGSECQLQLACSEAKTKSECQSVGEDVSGGCRWLADLQCEPDGFKTNLDYDQNKGSCVSETYYAKALAENGEGAVLESLGLVPEYQCVYGMCGAQCSTVDDCTSAPIVEVDKVGQLYCSHISGCSGQCGCEYESEPLNPLIEPLLQCYGPKTVVKDLNNYECTEEGWVQKANAQFICEPRCGATCVSDDDCGPGAYCDVESSCGCRALPVISDFECDITSAYFADMKGEVISSAKDKQPVQIVIEHDDNCGGILADLKLEEVSGFISPRLLGVNFPTTIRLTENGKSSRDWTVVYDPYIFDFFTDLEYRFTVTAEKNGQREVEKSNILSVSSEDYEPTEEVCGSYLDCKVCPDINDDGIVDVSDANYADTQERDMDGDGDFDNCDISSCISYYNGLPKSQVGICQEVGPESVTCTLSACNVCPDLNNDSIVDVSDANYADTQKRDMDGDDDFDTCDVNTCISYYNGLPSSQVSSCQGVTPSDTCGGYFDCKVCPDLNNDGIVDASDANYADTQKRDMDGDGDFDNCDISSCISYYNGLPKSQVGICQGSITPEDGGTGTPSDGGTSGGGGGGSSGGGSDRRTRRPTVCFSNWQMTSWGECMSGFQERSVIDLNNCGTESNKPASVQPCGGRGGVIPEDCTPEWDCTEWSKCRSDGTQERACHDVQECGTGEGRPPLQESCVYESKALFIFIIFAIISALLVGTSWFVRRKAWWLSIVGSVLLMLVVAYLALGAELTGAMIGVTMALIFVSSIIIAERFNLPWWVTTLIVIVMSPIAIFLNINLTNKVGIVLGLLVILVAYLVAYFVRRRKIVTNSNVLDQFVTNSLKKGYSKAQIRKALEDKGWPRHMIDHVLR